jgi:hypothetical protein
MPPKTKDKPTRKPLAYRRVPVTDIVLDDDDMPRNPTQRYDWIALGDRAVALAKRDPSKWQLVDDNGPTSTASNITQGVYAPLQSKRFSGWKFRGRCSEIVADDENGRRAKIWIKAEPMELVL